jgi:hypothetical protein
MTESLHVLLDGEYLDAATELRAIAQEKKDLATREAECKRIIEKHLAVGERGVTPDGEEIVAVRAGASRFDADLAAANLPKELLAQISTVRADGKRAKAILAPALYDLCCDRNKASVVVL